MKRFDLNLGRLLIIVLAFLMWPHLPAHADQHRNLISGWDALPPYSYLESKQGVPHWQGLDVELLQEIARRAGYPIEYADLDWPTLVQGIESGIVDMVPQATYTSTRDAFAVFSRPYRHETVVMIAKRGQSANLPADTPGELVRMIKATGFRLGVLRGAAYPDAEIRAFISDPANSDQVVELEANEFLNSLIFGQIDGYLSDQIMAANEIEIRDAGDFVEEHPLRINGDLYLMFSKTSVQPEVVTAFNQAIESVHADGTYRRLNEKYAFPILVKLTLNNDWFFAVDIIGTIAFALSGLLLAFRYNYDIFGAFILAALPAVGGGVVRDLITNRDTLAFLSSPIYLQVIMILVVGGYAAIRVTMAMRKRSLGAAAVAFFGRRRDQINRLVQVSDAIGLAAFTVTGVVVALATGSSPIWLWGPLLAAITAAGGGILRDVVRSDPDVPFIKGEFYPEIAVIWGLILSFYFEHESRHLSMNDVTIGIVVTFVGAFLTRIATIYFGIRSPRFSS
ncbi:MAG: transporter substrate-binding domain-containing protein [Pseudomonadota bacterium]